MTLTEVLVVTVVLAVLVVVLLPAFIADRPSHAPRINCVSNLKEIGLAFMMWAGDHNDKYPIEISVADGGTMELAATGNVLATFQIMSNELSTPKVLFCPADTVHTITNTFGVNFTAKNISYFIGLDANTNRSRELLSGDDNFAIGGVPVKSGLLEISTKYPLTWTAARHVNQGNIGFADGSAGDVTTAKLKITLLQTGLATNRLAIP